MHRLIVGLTFDSPHSSYPKNELNKQQFLSIKKYLPYATVPHNTEVKHEHETFRIFSEEIFINFW